MCDAACVSGRMKRWQRRVRENEQRRAVEEAEIDRLERLLVSEAQAPDGVPVLIRLRPTGESPDLGDLSWVGLAISIPWWLTSWLLHRNGYTLWLSSNGYRPSKFRYPSLISALRDGPRLVNLIEAQGTNAVGLRPTRRTARQFRRDAQQPQDGVADRSDPSTQGRHRPSRRAPR